MDRSSFCAPLGTIRRTNFCPFAISVFSRSAPLGTIRRTNFCPFTVIANGQKFVLRMVPSGALRENTVCVIGNGTMVDPLALIEELDRLGDISPKTFKLSFDAHLVMPYHR